MITYTEKYGCDADGNRGRLVTEYEIEPSDYVEIHAQVIDQILDQMPEELEITLICPHTEEDIHFTVLLKDYLT